MRGSSYRALHLVFCSIFKLALPCLFPALNVRDLHDGSTTTQQGDVGKVVRPGRFTVMGSTSIPFLFLYILRLRTELPVNLVYHIPTKNFFSHIRYPRNGDSSTSRE